MPDILTATTWEDVSIAATMMGENCDCYAGFPVPIEDCALRLEPKHPLYARLHGKSLFSDAAKPPPADDGATFVNMWRHRRTQLRIYLWREQGATKTRFAFLPCSTPMERFRLTLNTLAAAHVWRTDAEAKAVEALQEMIGPFRSKQYLMTGMFLETSQRSNITYVFRRLRPTLAMAQYRGDMRIIAALCLHPIGYYDDSFAGCMVPTDEVVAHLSMMRGDEHGYWKKANQHDYLAPMAGI